MADDFADIESEMFQTLEANFNQAFPVPVATASSHDAATRVDTFDTWMAEPQRYIDIMPSSSSEFNNYMYSMPRVNAPSHDEATRDEPHRPRSGSSAVSNERPSRTTINRVVSSMMQMLVTARGGVSDLYEDHVLFGSSYFATRHSTRHEQHNASQGSAPAHAASSTSSQERRHTMWTKTRLMGDDIYTNSMSRVCELNVFIGTNSSSVSAITQTEADYQMLKNQLQAAGFIPPIINYQGKKIELWSSSPVALTNFMKVIKNYALNFNEIEPEISQKLGIDLSQNNINPHWFSEKIGSSDWQYYSVNTSSVVSQINLFDIGNGTMLTIKTATSAHYQALLAALLSAGVSPESMSNDLNHNQIVFRSRNRVAITDFMQVIKTLSVNFDEIESEVSQKLGIDLNQAYATQQPIWTKEGDFSRRINSGTTLIHNCTYKNNATSAMKTLHLCQYSDGEYKIWLTASNNAHYQALTQKMTQAGFPAQDRWSSPDITLITADKQIMANFFNVIKQNVPEFSEIAPDVCGALGVNLQQTPAIMPTWLREFDFNTRLEHSYGPLARHVSYKTGNAQSTITNFDLYGYRDNEFMFTASLSENSNQLKQALTASGLPLQFDESSREVRLRFNAGSRGNFNQLTTILSQHSTHFSEIATRFKQHVTPVIAAPTLAQGGVNLLSMAAASHSSSTTTHGLGLFSRATAGALPTIKNNQQKLDDIGFSEHQLTADDEKENYSKYRCLISTDVMTEPVYALGLPQYQYEKTEILRWLALKQEHPHTKTKLTPAGLMPNQSLKEEIDQFVNSRVTTHAASANAMKK